MPRSWACAAPAATHKTIAMRFMQFPLMKRMLTAKKRPAIGGNWTGPGGEAICRSPLDALDGSFQPELREIQDADSGERVHEQARVAVAMGPRAPAAREPGERRDYRQRAQRCGAGGEIR